MMILKIDNTMTAFSISNQIGNYATLTELNNNHITDNFIVLDK